MASLRISSRRPMSLRNATLNINTNGNVWALLRNAALMLLSSADQWKIGGTPQTCWRNTWTLPYINLHSFAFTMIFSLLYFLLMGKKTIYSLHETTVVSCLYFGPILFVILCVLILLKYISFIHTCQLSTGNDVSGCYFRHYFPFFLSQDLFK